MLEVKNLQVNLSNFMKDGKFYTSPLTFDSIDEYSRIDYILGIIRIKYKPRESNLLIFY